MADELRRRIGASEDAMVASMARRVRERLSGYRPGGTAGESGRADRWGEPTVHACEPADDDSAGQVIRCRRCGGRMGLPPRPDGRRWALVPAGPGPRDLFRCPHCGGEAPCTDQLPWERVEGLDGLARARAGEVEAGAARVAAPGTM